MASEKRLIWDEDAQHRLVALAVKRGNDAIPLDMITYILFYESPTVDAVEVVRCKDCKHRGDAEECPMRYFETDRSYDADGHMVLDYLDHDYTNDDGFCDRGERKDNE